MSKTHTMPDGSKMKGASHPKKKAKKKASGTSRSKPKTVMSKARSY